MVDLASEPNVTIWNACVSKSNYHQIVTIHNIVNIIKLCKKK